MKYALTLLLCAVTLYARGQAIGLQGPDKAGRRGFALQYQNDAFAKTDYYYSQGVQLAVALPALRKSILSRLLPGFGHNGAEKYGIALEHDAYTPTSILSDSILHGDRPYAAALMLQFYAITMPVQQYARLSSMISLGMVGPAAGGEELQTAIHRNTRNDLPHGWQYQVQNDLILNYSLLYEQHLLKAGSVFYTSAFAGLDAGTYNDRLLLGVDLKAGKLEHPLFEKQQRHFHVYLENAGSLQLVAYNATLQGGLFNHSSPYTLAAADIRRVVFKNTLGFNIGVKQFTLTGNYTWLSPEFRSGRSHAWGGLQVAWRF